MLLLQQMIVLFIYMMIGYFSCKKGYLDQNTSGKLSWIVVNVANPALIISSAVNGEGQIQGSELLMTAGIAFGMFAVLLVLAQILPLLLRVKQDDIPLYKLMTVFSNMGFMGFPVIAAAYGSDALLYGAIFMLPFNVLIYTYGIRVVDNESSNKMEWKKVFNSGLIACMFAGVLYLSRIPLPHFFKSAVQGLGNLAGPISMMVLGISLTKIPIRELFTNVKLLIFSGIRLLVIPICGTFLLKQFVSNEVLCGVCMIIMATPVASMTIMLAEEKRENCEVLVKGILLTTILSVVTIPLVSAIVF